MRTYSFFPELIVRNPLFSFKDYSLKTYEKHVCDPFFKGAIYIPSPGLYNELQKRGFDPADFSISHKNTLLKYLNRTSYRSVPFGAFSSISRILWKENDEFVQFKKDSADIRVKLDFQASLTVYNALIQLEAPKETLFKSNSSIYSVFDQYRYIKHVISPTSEKRSFAISALSKNPVLKRILYFCATPKYLTEIIQFTSSIVRMGEEAVAHYIAQLIEEQLLIANTPTGVTGPDCLENLLESFNGQVTMSDRISATRTIIDTLHSVQPGCLDQLKEHDLALRQLFPELKEKNNIFYVITERTNAKGGLNTRYQEIILDSLNCLNKLTTYHPNESLENFTSSFIKKFENIELPLLYALDPEVGIGYENLEDFPEQVSLLKDMPFEDTSVNDEKYMVWTPVHAFLLNRLNQYRNTGDNSCEIRISENDLNDIPTQKGKHQLPPSISVVFRLLNNAVYLESAGGTSATSLLGRFSFASDSIDAVTKSIARMEQNVNDSVIFAEIAHASESHTDNINRRRHIRDYEIPVVTGSTMEEGTQIPLSDLYVSVVNKEIVLRSRDLNMVIVPRLSSAYNFGHSELSVFRFLCDLQNQGLKTNLKLDLELFLPGLVFYPRVVYKSSILCLAKWVVEAKEYAFLKTKEPSFWYSEFLQLRERIRLPRYFSLTQHDNHLVFDAYDCDEILLLLDIIKNERQIQIAEHLMDRECIMQETEREYKPLASQYIASLYLKEPVYKSSGKKISTTHLAEKSFMPGTEWLYFKIYCNPIRSNEILYKTLLPVLNNAQSQQVVDKWFFVRYKDPNYHIRLRIHVNNKASGQLLACFIDKIAGLVKEGIIEKYYLDTYIRELERYTPLLIDNVESFFYRSSQLSLNYFKHHASGSNEYIFDLDLIIVSIDLILNSFEYEVEEKSMLFATAFENMYEEFGGRKELKKSLDKKFNFLRSKVDEIYTNRKSIKSGKFKSMYSDLEIAAKAIFNKIRKKNCLYKQKLVSDLLHMHLNKIFVQTPRRHELVIYYVLYKHYNCIVYNKL